MDEKSMLHRYLQNQRNPVIWKLSTLSERQLRMPMTRTGTNLLGVAKHVASVDAEYFGVILGRPLPEPTPWMDEDAEPNADFWATEDQSADWIRGFCRRAWEHSDRTISELPLDAPAVVPWWGDDRKNTDLRTLLVHVIAETARHVGQMDIVREVIDGQAGMNEAWSNLPDIGDQDWKDYVRRLRELAERFPDIPSPQANPATTGES